MVIYVLKPAQGVDFGYDNYDGFVVRAGSEVEARQMAYVLAVDDNLNKNKAKWWQDASKTTCVEAPLEGEPEIILASFLYG